MGPERRPFPSALGFALAAALCRVVLATTHSRLQIYAFVIFAALYEAAAPLLWRQRPGWRRFALNSAGAIVAIVAVKIAIDRHIHVPRDLAQAWRALKP